MKFFCFSVFTIFSYNFFENWYELTLNKYIFIFLPYILILFSFGCCRVERIMMQWCIYTKCTLQFIFKLFRITGRSLYVYFHQNDVENVFHFGCQEIEYLANLTNSFFCWFTAIDYFNISRHISFGSLLTKRFSS